MRTKNAEFSKYDDFEMRTEGLRLTLENSCWVSLGRNGLGTTEIMQRFREDKKTYMVFRVGLYDSCWISLVAEVQRVKHATKEMPPISSVKKMVDKELYFSNHGGKSVMGSYSAQMRPLIQTILDSLPEKSESGLYKIRAETPACFKAQCDDDRRGFGKTRFSEKNYGDCSMVFSVVGVYLR